SARPVLMPDESATLREQLTADLSAINSADDAAVWAHRNMPVKNSLTAADAQVVEARFQARLAAIGEGVTVEQLNALPGHKALSTGQLAAETTQETSTVPKQGARRHAVLKKTIRLREKSSATAVTRNSAGFPKICA